MNKCTNYYFKNLGIKSRAIHSFLHQEFSKCSKYQHLLEGLLKQFPCVPLLEFLIQSVWDGGREFAFVIISQVMLLLMQLVWGPHFENYSFGSSGYQPVCGLAVFFFFFKYSLFYFISLEFKCWFLS